MCIKKLLFTMFAVLVLTIAFVSQSYARTSRSYRDTSHVSRTVSPHHPSSTTNTKVVRRTVTHTTYINNVHYGHPRYYHHHCHECFCHYHHPVYCPHGYLYHECPYEQDYQEDVNLLNINIKL